MMTPQRPSLSIARRWLVSVFALILGGGVPGGPAAALEVPFVAPPTISATVAFTRAVFAADIDGDGDLDIVSAAFSDDTVAWHENDGTAGGWDLHVISSDADAATSVFAADIDGDGDLDVLSSAGIGNEIAWHRNDTIHRSAVFLGPLEISGAADANNAVFAADLDGDGSVDVLSASFHDDKIAWYQNGGGQFALPTTDIAQKIGANGEVHDLLAIQLAHRGRAADGDVELTSLQLRFSDDTGFPLSTGQAQDLIAELRLYLDDGSGRFEEDADTLLVQMVDLSLSLGVQPIVFTEGDPDARVAHGAPKTYFVVVEMTADADQQDPSIFAVESLLTHGFLGKYADHDLELTLEPAPEVGTGAIDTVLNSDSCQAPFDLQLANRTVSSNLVCEAGTVIRAGSSFVVVSPGQLTFRAGQAVELAPVRIESGSFNAGIDPGLEP